LTKNTDADSRLGQGQSEAVWTISGKFLAAIDDWKARLPNATRPEIMDAVYMDFIASLKMRHEIDVDAPGLVVAPEPADQKKKRKKSGNIGAGLGESLPERVARQPFTLEMMLGTRQCWIAYDKAIFKDAHVNSMLRENGAPMAAKFWLSMEVLIKVGLERLY
jgi:hypothetical protein